MLNPSEVGVALRRHAVAPALVLGQPVAAPVRDVERRVATDERDGPHEHARRAAARVVDPALVRLQHLDQHLDDAPRSVEFAAFLVLGACELRQEVLVDATEHVAGPRVLVAHSDVADKIDQLAEPPLVERRPGVVAGQHVLERRVLTLDGGHRLIDGQADGGLPRLRPQIRPASFGRRPEDGDVLVATLGGVLAPLGENGRVALFEGVGDVLQEEEAEDDVLVFGGVHRSAQRIGHRPQLGLVADGGSAVRDRLRVARLPPGASSRHAVIPSLTNPDLRAATPALVHPIAYNQPPGSSTVRPCSPPSTESDTQNGG